MASGTGSGGEGRGGEGGGGKTFLATGFALAVDCFGAGNDVFGVDGSVFRGEGLLGVFCVGVAIDGVVLGITSCAVRCGVWGGALLVGDDLPHSLMGRVRSRSASFHTSHVCCVYALVGVLERRCSGSSLTIVSCKQAKTNRSVPSVTDGVGSLKKRRFKLNYGLMLGNTILKQVRLVFCALANATEQQQRSQQLVNLECVLMVVAEESSTSRVTSVRVCACVGYRFKKKKRVRRPRTLNHFLDVRTYGRTC